MFTIVLNHYLPPSLAKRFTPPPGKVKLKDVTINSLRLSLFIHILERNCLPELLILDVPVTHFLLSRAFFDYPKSEVVHLLFLPFPPLSTQ